jgi:hypothetical protein
MEHSKSILKALLFSVVGVFIPSLIISLDMADGFFSHIVLCVPPLAYLGFGAETERLMFVPCSFMFSAVMMIVAYIIGGTGSESAVMLLLFALLMVAVMYLDFIITIIYCLVKKKHRPPQAEQAATDEETDEETE